MLFDGLLVVDLPSVEGPPVAAPFWEGLERLLFDGHWRRRPRRVTLSTAAVLSGCYTALRPVAAGPIRVMDDAGELFSVEVTPADYGEAPPPWAEILPPDWGRSPAAFAMDLAIAASESTESAFAATLRLRYVPEPPDHQPPLVGALRVAWSPSGDLSALAPTLQSHDFLAGLRDALQEEGRALGREILGRLSALGAGEVRGEVRVLASPEDERFGEILRGFPEPARVAVTMASARAAAEGRWAALAPDGVQGEVQAGRFVAGASTEVGLAV